jgi:SagB-type dehydrogenase family enzyme
MQSKMLIVFLLLIAGSSKAESTAGKDQTMQPLPPPILKGTVSVEETLAQRRSVREFKPEALSTGQISQLLWAAQGITEKRAQLRTAPSAGATYPLNTYLVTAQGVFRYDPEKHALRPQREGDVRPALAEAALGQAWVRQAPVAIVFAAIYARTTGRYGERGRQYVQIEVGHAAENVHLQAVALGLGSVPIGAFRDEQVADALGLNPEERPLYLIPVGVPR